jgi:hypothetical protein
MLNIAALTSRLWRSAVAWSWLMNGLRVGGAVLLLPLLVRQLSRPDLGMHYVLLSLGSLAMMVDFGFAGAIWRAVCIALAGGRELRAEGIAATDGKSQGPNHELLWHVLDTTRILYLSLAGAAVLLLGTGGTILVAQHVHETSSPGVTWLAWALTLAGATWEVYAGWWSTYLTALNHVTTYARLNFLAQLLKLALAAAMLAAGLGLLSVPLATLIATFFQRILARRACLAVLAEWPRPERPPEVRKLLAHLWPNAWRQGVVGVSNYLGASALALLCLKFFGLAANAQYGLSIQLLAAAQGMAATWTQVKWPEIAQHCARGDLAAMRRIFRPRLLRQLASQIILNILIVLGAQSALHWLGSNKEVLPLAWFALLAANTVGESHLSAWGMLITTGNRVPATWAILASNVAGLLLTFALAATVLPNVGALILAPLLVGCAFNYWYWPAYGARFIESGWFRFMFRRELVSTAPPKS